MALGASAGLRYLKHDAFDGFVEALVPVTFVFPVEAAEAAVEFVGEQIEGFVGVVTFDASDEIRSADF